MAHPESVPLDLPSDLTRAQLRGLIAAFLLRLSAQWGFDIAYQNDKVNDLVARFPGYFAPWVPLKVEASGDTSISTFVDSIGEKISLLGSQGTYLKDVFLRHPNLQEPSCVRPDRPLGRILVATD